MKFKISPEFINGYSRHSRRFGFFYLFKFEIMWSVDNTFNPARNFWFVFAVLGIGIFINVAVWKN
ncbi:MAG: hypothetical protein WC755_09325, partial [Candidatus Woesearchaeota archaeon]